MGAGRILLSTLSKSDVFYDPGLGSIDAGNNATGPVNLVSRQAARTLCKKGRFAVTKGSKTKLTQTVKVLLVLRDMCGIELRTDRCNYDYSVVCNMGNLLSLG